MWTHTVTIPIDFNRFQSILIHFFNCFLYFFAQIREEALQKELQALRLALLKKRTCSNCSNCQTNSTATNVVDETVIDFVNF